MALVGEALDAPGGELDLDLVELGDADQLLSRFDALVDGFIAGCVKDDMTFVRGDGKDGTEKGVGAGVDEGAQHGPLLHQGPEVVEDVGFFP